MYGHILTWLSNQKQALSFSVMTPPEKMQVFVTLCMYNYIYY
ncbi:hypothetical protein B4129_2434 [Bacillus safensis]|nr:hypothetical protein B4129_2434 [Bacillus safensis]